MYRRYGSPQNGNKSISHTSNMEDRVSTILTKKEAKEQPKRERRQEEKHEKEPNKEPYPGKEHPRMYDKNMPAERQYSRPAKDTAEQGLESRQRLNIASQTEEVRYSSKRKKKSCLQRQNQEHNKTC